jgi:hypothetical protein
MAHNGRPLPLNPASLHELSVVRNNPPAHPPPHFMHRLLALHSDDLATRTKGRRRDPGDPRAMRGLMGQDR